MVTPTPNKPRIAIPTPTTFDADYNARSWDSYAGAVERSGGQAVRVPLDISAAGLRELAAGVQGICLPGSPADVDTQRYGEERHEATAAPDPAREAVDFFLLEHAQRRAKPLLAICFGLQSMNVWRGGTLVQDLVPLPVNHAAGSKVAIAHTALIAEHSALGELLAADAEARLEAPAVDGFLRLPVNTSHHQAVSIAGQDLQVVARSPEDGVVEAVDGMARADAALFLGVQWHPERSYAISAASRALFARLVGDAARWAEQAQAEQAQAEQARAGEVRVEQAKAAEA